MDLERARDQLFVRYYQWACREWDAELARDFARIRDTQTRSAEEFLGALARLTPDKVPIAIRAITKRAHADALPLIGETISLEERRLLHDLTIYRRMWANKNPRQARTALVARQQLAALIQDRLRDLGTRESVEQSEWRYVSDVHGWTIHTYVDFGGGPRDLSYEHYLLAGSTRAIPCSISLLSALGISRTKWRITNEREADFAASQIVYLSRYFLQSVPELTLGIRVES